MPPLRAGLPLALLALAACSGTTPRRSATPSPAPVSDASVAPDVPLVDPGFAVVALTLRPTADGGTGRVVELREDGTLTSGGRVVGRVEPRRVLSLGGREVLTVDPHGLVLIGGMQGPEQSRMQDDAAVVARTPDGAERRLLFDPDGTPVDLHPTGQRERANVRFDALPEGARGTAMLLVLAMLVPRQVTGEPPMDSVEGDDAGAPDDASADAPAPDAPAPDAGRRPRARQAPTRPVSPGARPPSAP